MTSSSRKDIVRAYVEAFNRGDMDAVCRCFAPDLNRVREADENPEVMISFDQLVSSLRFRC